MSKRYKRQPDRIDVTILTELKKYPPSTMRYIATVVKRAHITVRQRFAWLETNGYIKQAENTVEGSARSKVLTVKGFRYLDDVKNF